VDVNNFRSTQPPTISVQQLRKTWSGGIEAVRGIDFEVAPGEVFGLLGPNGAGKSTTIGILTTTVEPTSGRAVLGGHDVATDPIPVRAVSGVVFQDSVVDNRLTGRRNLDIHARLWGVGRDTARTRSDELAAAAGITDLLDRPVATYSGGQRRRLEIVRALVPRPSVLFLDEPTVGLDPRIRHELLHLIDRLRRDHDMTVLLTTHYLDEAERLCDRIGVMHEGELVAVGTPSSLLAALGEVVIELHFGSRIDIGSAVRSVRAADKSFAAAFAVGNTVALPVTRSGAAQASSALEALELPTVVTLERPPTLDDVYLSLTSAPLAA
jgi:ABC-2 type transport system ATP-binding protein